MFVPAVAFSQNCSGAAALQKHIYKPQRLVQQKPCVTVKGIIRVKIAEGDGDYHVRLELDPDQPKNVLLNARNKAGQHGFLVFEPICVNDVKQQSALKACGATSAKKHWKQEISLPNDGDHVEVLWPVGSVISGSIASAFREAGIKRLARAASLGFRILQRQ
jgi:hypothetical protein